MACECSSGAKHLIRDEELLAAAVEDNVGWCGAVVAAHGGAPVATSAIWLNPTRSPRFYPNLITRRRGARAEVDGAIARLRDALAPGWGIKDSFADLDLSEDLKPAIRADWYGVRPHAARLPPGWRRVGDAAGLAAWETAWGEGAASRTFPEQLLGRSDIAFWCRGADGAITAGFVAHVTACAVGLSNWFAVDTEAALADAVDVAAASWPDRPDRVLVVRPGRIDGGAPAWRAHRVDRGLRPYPSGFSPATIFARRPSRCGGRISCSPSLSGASSMAKPGPSVASSMRMPFGSRM
jgi:hypothetical protein